MIFTADRFHDLSLVSLVSVLGLFLIPSVRRDHKAISISSEVPAQSRGNIALVLCSTRSRTQIDEILHSSISIPTINRYIVQPVTDTAAKIGGLSG